MPGFLTQSTSSVPLGKLFLYVFIIVSTLQSSSRNKHSMTANNKYNSNKQTNGKNEVKMKRTGLERWLRG